MRICLIISCLAPIVGIPANAGEAPAIDWDKARQSWAFQLPGSVSIPDNPKLASWPRGDIDRFILQKVENAGFEPTPEADRATLLRRITYDLTGLPPTTEEQSAFLEDFAPDAYEHLVDRLLASPRFGERFASLWLNVMRYAEDQAHKVGKNTKYFYPNAFRYRKWVIDAFNRDLSYDKFLKLQLAADFYGDEAHEDLVALGFLGLGPQYYNRKRLDVMADEWEDAVDTVTRGLMGVTVACARCHAHKYDPFTMRDYYALAGVFASTVVDKRKIGEDEYHLVKDGKVQDLPIFNRGNVEDKGAVVPRGFLEVFAQGETVKFENGSGRKELAELIASRDNPLTARVIVNRLWGEIFGKPIVRTPSNFGSLGEKPSHPELLDFLALQFMDEGWSMKKLIRRMVLSATYRQGSVASLPARKADPSNRLLSHMNRRRLSAEMMRDSMLFASGELDDSEGGKSLGLEDTKNKRRTVYARVSRLDLDPFLRQFDYPDANVHAAKRVGTTTPGQKLYMLNSPFVLEQSVKAAERFPEIDELYRSIVGRPPSPDELAMTRTHESDSDRVALAQVLFCSNAFLFRD